MKADFTQRKVDAPFNRWCDSGHEAPSSYNKDGQEKEVCFYQVTSKTVSGTYCELCLIVAQNMAQKKRGK